MAWHRPGDKPLSEPMLFFLRIYASLSLNELKSWNNRTGKALRLLRVWFPHIPQP